MLSGPVIQPSREFLDLQRVLAGRFSLERELGRGGMGVVFLARDVALNRVVAIKLLPAHLAQQPDARERFLREARTAAGLFHPNIVPIHLVEEHGDLVFFVMAYVDGESLGERARRAGPLTPSAARRMIQEVAWALSYAHGHGVVHRDVKPDNILLERASGRALVTDFGIARVADATGVTGRGEIVGTVLYMSPEQATGEAVDGRSDLYSLGVTAYYALTGRLLFDAPNVPAIIHQHVNVPAPRVAAQAPSAPAKLAEAVDRCLAKDPAQRWASGEALAEAIAEAGAAPSTVPPEVRALLRTVRVTGVAIGLVFAVGGPLIWLAADIARLAGELPRLAKMWLWIVGAGGVVQQARQLIRDARRVIARGMDVNHVRSALAEEGRALAEELQVIYQDKSAQLQWQQMNREGLIRWGPRIAAIGAASVPLLIAVGDTIAGLVLGCCLFVAGVLAFLAGPATAADSPLRALGWGERLLVGRFGQLLFGLARLGLKHRAPAAPAPGERTEVVLASAADDLFDRLPAAARKQFGDVPDVIRRLEADANALRKREQVVSDALARVDIAAGGAQHGGRRAAKEDLEAARAGVRERLATAVAALENIRLDLLRLQAGVGSAEDLTADIERAREVGEAVSMELAGRREVERLLASPGSP